MNLEKTKEYRVICEQLKRILLDDLATTLVDRQAKANERHRSNQKAFLDDMKARGINTDVTLIEAL